MSYEHLIPEFLEAMNDIGRYGEEKYGSESFQQRSKRNDRTRMNRTEPSANMMMEFYFSGLETESSA